MLRHRRRRKLSDWSWDDERMIRAVKHHSIDLIRQLIEGRVNPTNYDPHRGTTALHVAALRGLVDVLDIFLQLSIDVNVRDSKGRTPLHCTVRHAYYVATYRLLQVGAAVDEVDHDGCPPLHHACLGRNYHCVQLLVAFGASLNVIDKRGRSALYYAASKGQASVCRLLLENGADVNVSDATRQTPLMVAASSGFAALCDYLIRKGAMIGQLDVQGHDALWYATSSNSADVITLIQRKLRSFKDIGTPSEVSTTPPLHKPDTTTTSKGDLETVACATDPMPSTSTPSVGFEPAPSEVNADCSATRTRYQSLTAEGALDKAIAADGRTSVATAEVGDQQNCRLSQHSTCSTTSIIEPPDDFRSATDATLRTKDETDQCERQLALFNDQKQKLDKQMNDLVGQMSVLNVIRNALADRCLAVQFYLQWICSELSRVNDFTRVVRIDLTSDSQSLTPFTGDQWKRRVGSLVDRVQVLLLFLETLVQVSRIRSLLCRTSPTLDVTDDELGLIIGRVPDFGRPTAEVQHEASVRDRISLSLAPQKIGETAQEVTQTVEEFLFTSEFCAQFVDEIITEILSDSFSYSATESQLQTETYAEYDDEQLQQPLLIEDKTVAETATIVELFEERMSDVVDFAKEKFTTTAHDEIDSSQHAKVNSCLAQSSTTSTLGEERSVLYCQPLNSIVTSRSKNDGMDAGDREKTPETDKTTKRLKTASDDDAEVRDVTSTEQNAAENGDERYFLATKLNQLDSYVRRLPVFDRFDDDDENDDVEFTTAQVDVETLVNDTGVELSATDSTLDCSSDLFTDQLTPRDLNFDFEDDFPADRLTDESFGKLPMSELGALSPKSIDYQSDSTEVDSSAAARNPPMKRGHRRTRLRAAAASTASTRTVGGGGQFARDQQATSGAHRSGEQISLQMAYIEELLAEINTLKATIEQLRRRDGQRLLLVDDGSAAQRQPLTVSTGSEPMTSTPRTLRSFQIHGVRFEDECESTDNRCDEATRHAATSGLTTLPLNTMETIHIAHEGDIFTRLQPQITVATGTLLQPPPTNSRRGDERAQVGPVGSEPSPSLVSHHMLPSVELQQADVAEAPQFASAYDEVCSNPNGRYLYGSTSFLRSHSTDPNYDGNSSSASATASVIPDLIRSSDNRVKAQQDAECSPPPQQLQQQHQPATTAGTSDEYAHRLMLQLSRVCTALRNVDYDAILSSLDAGDFDDVEDLQFIVIQLRRLVDEKEVLSSKMYLLEDEIDRLIDELWKSEKRQADRSLPVIPEEPPNNEEELEQLILLIEAKDDELQGVRRTLAERNCLVNVLQDQVDRLERALASAEVGRRERSPDSRRKERNERAASVVTVVRQCTEVTEELRSVHKKQRATVEEVQEMFDDSSSVSELVSEVEHCEQRRNGDDVIYVGAHAESEAATQSTVTDVTHISDFVEQIESSEHGMYVPVVVESQAETLSETFTALVGSMRLKESTHEIISNSTDLNDLRTEPVADVLWTSEERKLVVTSGVQTDETDEANVRVPINDGEDANNEELNWLLAKIENLESENEQLNRENERLVMVLEMERLKKFPSSDETDDDATTRADSSVDVDLALMTSRKINETDYEYEKSVQLKVDDVALVEDIELSHSPSTADVRIRNTATETDSPHHLSELSSTSSRWYYESATDTLQQSSAHNSWSYNESLLSTPPLSISLLPSDAGSGAAAATSAFDRRPSRELSRLVSHMRRNNSELAQYLEVLADIVTMPRSSMSSSSFESDAATVLQSGSSLSSSAVYSDDYSNSQFSFQ